MYSNWAVSAVSYPSCLNNMQSVILNKTGGQESWRYYLPLGLMALIGWIILFILVVLLLFWPKTIKPRVYLPYASACVEDLTIDKARPIIYISHSMPEGEHCPQLQYRKDSGLIQPCRILEHWQITIRGKEISKESLDMILKKEGDLDRPNGPNTPSARPIMIRADASAPYSLVKYVLKSAVKARVWKIEFGATKPSE